MADIQATVLSSPTDAQIEEMVDLTVASFAKDATINAMTGGQRESQISLFRLALRAAALEGRIWTCILPGKDAIVSVGVCFGPGVNYLGSEAQQALGAAEFFGGLPEETQKWWNEVNRPASKEFVAGTIGEEKIRNGWFVAVMATLENERQKGYGGAIVKAICKQAQEDNTLSVLNATTEQTVKFYKDLGFQSVGMAYRETPFGNWTNTLMVYNDNFA